MLLQAISVGVAAIEAYAIAGVVFAAVFLTRGIAQVESEAEPKFLSHAQLLPNGRTTPPIRPRRRWAPPA